MRTMIPFNDNWLFLKPGENRVPVTLPHTWNNLDGQDGGGDYWRGECVYENTRRMAEALKKAGVPYQCEIFPGVDHGVGPGKETAAEGWIDHAVAFWKQQMK